MITITTVEGLQAIQNDLTADYELGCDIDLSSLEKWTPIGTPEDVNVSFNGTLNGNGHKIKNMTITINSTYDNNLVGFFRMLGDCTIKNLVFENTTINSTGYNNCTGILAGGVYYKAPQIENVSVQGTINVTHNYLYTQYAFRGVGGFIGSCYGDTNYMTFKDCISNVNINITGSTRSIYVGGFIGYSRYTKLYRCFAFGTIAVQEKSGEQYFNIGGFCPHIYSSTHNYCGSAVSISGTNSTNCSSCCKYLTETSSFTNNNSRRIWNGATFSYEDYVSSSDTLVTQDEFIALIDDEDKFKYNLTDLDFANGKYLKLAIDTSETIYNIPLFGVTYNNVKKVIYNGNEVSKFYLDGGVVFEKSSSEEPSTGETWVLNEEPHFSPFIKVIEEDTGIVAQIKFEVNCSINSVSYSLLIFESELVPMHTDAVSIIAKNTPTDRNNIYYSGSWVDEVYRTITFNVAPAGDLLKWLQANGTKQ